MSKATKRKAHPIQSDNSTIKQARQKLGVHDEDLIDQAPAKSIDQSINNLSLKPDTLTTNSSPAYSTTGNQQVDLFFSTLVRGTDVQDINQALERSWATSPIETLRLIAQARDCRGGKGERLTSYHSMLWLRRNKPKTYLCNLLNFLDIGCFKDLLQIVKLVGSGKDWSEMLSIDGEPVELHVFAEFLKYDYDVLTEVLSKQTSNQSEDQSTKNLPLSLAAKWAPSEGSHFDKAPFKLAHRLAKLVFGKQSTSQSSNEVDKSLMKKYRSCLSSLRSQLQIIEKFACQNEWSSINYSIVPSKCHLLLKKAFQKHDQERYSEYLANLKTGKTTIKSTSLMPHELVNQYLMHHHEDVDETVEAQWKDLVTKLREAGGFKNAVAVVDVSGSMSSGTPRAMDVAIALGLVVSELTEGAYHNRVITFHSEPAWHSLPEASLKERVQSIASADWGMSTNLQATFDLILKLAVEMQIPPENMPTKLFIFSDMQFDSAMRPSFGLSDHQVARMKYSAAGYQAPSIIYWNLVGGHKSVPVTVDSAGTAMLSGFSSDLLKQVMDGAEISVVSVMRSAIAKYTSFNVVKQDW